MVIEYIRSGLQLGGLDGVLTELYGNKGLERQKNRYLEAINGLQARFSLDDGTEAAFYSAPGRAEISGNHTDHQRGRVLAAAIDADIICAAVKNERVELVAESYGEVFFDVPANSGGLCAQGTPQSLAEGVFDYFLMSGYEVGGFRAFIMSDVREGSGLSSSAAFANLIGTVLNHEYNGGRVPPLDIAKASRHAENVFFGKPCGLMDQAASSHGGFVFIDFGHKEPVIESIPFRPDEYGLALCVVHTGGSHAGLTDEYAAITLDMRGVAAALGGEVLGFCDSAVFYGEIISLREKLGDRAVLRAHHFFNETARVEKQAGMLKNKDLEGFLQLVNESGRSSIAYLQNTHAASMPENQPISLALALAERGLSGKGAFRVHGGGFAGTILAFVPIEIYDHFEDTLNTAFGADSCHRLSVRQSGAVRVI
ncbi:MAG: galactokinase [Defluviitaleaceae bacterium]|nr:galactokinase [Defluviitaleaceae bacterium]MCL2836863.1 galactokinase [Defluviitaleaceae bacterium]